MKQAVILAGGKGTRLRERLGGLPKPLIDVCGTPLLERQIHLLQRHGFRHVLVLVNHAADTIVEFCSAERFSDLRIECIDDGKPRGTAGAVLAVMERLDEDFLVLYGDTMLEVDLSRLVAFHASKGNAGATLFLHPNDHPQDSDLVELGASGDVLAFHSYPHDENRYLPNLVNAALYCIRRDALKPWRDAPGLLDFGKQLFPWMLDAGIRLHGFVSPEYIKDVGTPSRIDKVCNDFRSGKIQRSSLEVPQPIIFLDRDGTLNREVGHLKDAEQFDLLPGVAEAIRAINGSDYRCCVVTNQPVIARGDCTERDLQQVHNKMESLLGRSGAFIDRIYLCPHHPDRGFPNERVDLKIQCACRKPATGMLDRAASEFNIDRSRSWMIGDTTIDIEAARRFGVRSILVETGYAGLDDRFPVQPDYVVPDLNAAVRFILEGYPRLASWTETFAGRLIPGAMVLIGGQSRAGKSTLASALKEACVTRGLTPRVVHLDAWLLAAHSRGEGILQRYALNPVRSLVRAHGEGRSEMLSIPHYRRVQRDSIPDQTSMRVDPHDVLIVDGVLAHSLQDSAHPAVHRLNAVIEESERRMRVLREYRLRGCSENEAERVYADRMIDEFPIIRQLAADAEEVNVNRIMFPSQSSGMELRR